MSSPVPIDFSRARYSLAAHYPNQWPEDDGAEVAFAGRSNVGKSSAINAITNQNRLAKTSKTPGRTQQIVFFDLTESIRLVDLPGYGFAYYASNQMADTMQQLRKVQAKINSRRAPTWNTTQLKKNVSGT